MRKGESTSLPDLLFLVRSLDAGGSERQLVTLARGLSHRGESLAVATFYAGGDLRNDLEGERAPVFSLDKWGRWDTFGFFRRFVQLIRDLRPEILYSYLGTPNILSVAVKLLFPKIQVVWGIRASNMDLKQYSWFERVLYRVEIMFSRFADLIIVNSFAGFDYAKLNGFPSEKMIVIPNGIDITTFCPDPGLQKKNRTDWGVSPNDKLIGLVGRLDPMKDHPTFLKAAALMLQERKDIRYVCIGDGPPAYRMKLQALSRELGLDHCLVWTGRRGDMVAVYNAMDIASSSSSFGEGFSNVIGEAMACGVPCVVTDVGDSAWIVGDTGEVVPIRNPQALVEGWRRMLCRLDDDPSLRFEVRDRIVQHFGLDSLLDKTTSALNPLCQASQ